MAWNRFKKRKEMPGGLWMKCPSCGGTVYRPEVEKRLHVCPECGYHFAIPVGERLRITLDEGSFEELFSDIESRDVLGFADRIPYLEKIAESKKKTGLTEAAVIGTGKLNGQSIVFGILDFSFMGGSMGAVVGERVTRGIELATEDRVPLIIVSSSGGARMQEGVISLMQMAKTNSALARYDDAGGCFISVLANPVTGGVMASYASQGDLVIAEPGALIGFAGPRVIEATIKQELPEGFQRAEFLLKHGFIDRIVPRPQLRDELATFLKYLPVRAREPAGARP